MGEDPTLESFRRLVLARGAELYRDLPWRRTRDPYQVWISEVMLQQTQVTRVDGRWQRWVELFPTPDALAAADSADVLEEWQGMGYKRRALSLWKAAGMVSAAGRPDAARVCGPPRPAWHRSRDGGGHPSLLL